MKHFCLGLLLACSSVASAIPLSVATPDTLLPQGTNLNCDNVTDGGLICCNQTVCIGTQPDILLGQAATGGTGTLSYDWLFLDTHALPYPIWRLVPGATGADYQPDTLYETQYFMREARREGCTFWIVANVITLNVDSTCGVLTTRNPTLSSLPWLTLTPNPCAEQTTLHNEATEPLTVTLFSLNGQALRSSRLPAGTTLEMATNDLPAGLYFLRTVRPDGRQWSTKLIKAAPKN